MMQEAVDVSDEVRRGIIELLPRLRRFAYVLSGGSDQGDDLVQESCVRALSNLERFEPGTRLDSWMYRIMRNIWLDHLRTAKVRGIMTDIDAAPEPAGEDGRNVAENRLTLRGVINALDELPPQQRIVIALVCFEGLSYQEAAEVLDIPIGTVTSRLIRGKKKNCALAIDGPSILESENGQSNR
jgi:RNA polymerase sigma-70 factor (ECF subfamily)